MDKVKCDFEDIKRAENGPKKYLDCFLGAQAPKSLWKCTTNTGKKPSTKHLKAILDSIQPIIPELNSKAQALVEIIRKAAAQITNRVNLLAAAGISLVRTRTHSNTNILTKLNTISLYSFIGGHTGRSRRYGPDITIFYPTKLPAVSNNGNTHIIHQSFFQN